jgi:hypothetical protein
MFVTCLHLKNKKYCDTYVHASVPHCMCPSHGISCMLRNQQEVFNTGCISELGNFKNVMISKCFHLFSFNTYEHTVYIKEFRFFQFQFNTLKTKVLLSENNFIQMNTIPL